MRLSKHAWARLKERFPEFRHLSRADAEKLVRREVSQAIQAGRFAKREPRHMVSPGEQRMKRRGAQRNCRYAWDETAGRVFALAPEGTGWLVTTIIRARYLADGEAA